MQSGVYVGRFFACTRCRDLVGFDPSAADRLSVGKSLDCPTCGSHLSAEDLFGQMLAPETDSTLRLVADHYEAGEANVELGIAISIWLAQSVERILAIDLKPDFPWVFARAVALDRQSFAIVSSVPDGDVLHELKHVRVRWKAFCRLPQREAPAWVSFLDSCYLAFAEEDYRAVVIDAHSALDVFLSAHQADMLQRRGVDRAASEWLVGSFSDMGRKLGNLLKATDGFTLQERDKALWDELDQSNKRRRDVVHRAFGRVTRDDARKSLAAVLSTIRMLDPRMFWRAMLGYASLPEDRVEAAEFPLRSVRIKFGVEMACTPSISLAGPCAAHLTVSGVSPSGLTLTHSDPLDHQWDYQLVREANP